MRRGEAAGREVRGRAGADAAALAGAGTRAFGAAAGFGFDGAGALAAGFEAAARGSGFSARTSARAASATWRRCRARSSFRTRLASRRAASASWRSSRRSCFLIPGCIFASGDFLASPLALLDPLERFFAISNPFRGGAAGRRAPPDPARVGSRRSISRPARPSTVQSPSVRMSGGNSQRRTPCPGCRGRTTSIRTSVAFRIGRSATPTSSAASMLKSGS